MSILIKGMEMPKCCRECPCIEYSAFSSNSDWCCLNKADIHDKTVVSSDCPLVEIPSKHGDLIDRDSLQKQSHVIEEYHPELQRQGMPKKVIYIEDVEKAPTIIEKVNENEFF